MFLSVALVLLQLFGNAFVLAQNDCSKLPNVPHAQLSTESQKAPYQKGDTITFTCEMGYTSGRHIRYVCTNQGWTSEHDGTCRLKPCVLPDDIPNGYYQIITGEDYVFGTIIKYFCNEGYQMISKEDTRTCLVSQWSNHLPVCETLSCEAPPANRGLIVQGLPDDDKPILPDRFLTFSCEAPGMSLNGSSTVICGKDGKWDKPFPNCIEATCEVPVNNPKLRIVGARDGTVTAGNKITVQCVSGGSSKQVECLPNGQWSSPFPTCIDTCDVLNIPDSVGTSSHVTPKVRRGQSLQFWCKDRRQVIQGSAQVTCLENGQWSHPFPTCRDPRGCGPPPLLQNGDTLTSSIQEFAQEFAQNTQVQYQCKRLYTMEGGPYKTCFNGEWRPEIKCLKPCTVDTNVMDPQNIKFAYSSESKLYAVHNTGLTFDCKPGKTHDGRVAMRQICQDGQMLLPTCY